MKQNLAFDDKQSSLIPKFPIQNCKITIEVEGKHNWKGKSVKEPTKPWSLVGKRAKTTWPTSPTGKGNLKLHPKNHHVFFNHQADRVQT
jgi:hypothetical protein